ncbi:MAG: threonine synthase [Bacteroidales bacterium]|nr:threonine synthase [Bacteroidales bacterium]
MQKEILFYSTNLKVPSVTFKEALLKGQAPDKGLYMPEIIPVIPEKEINDFYGMEYPEIAYEISKRFVLGDVPENILKEIVRDAYNYPVPLENVYENKWVMRLDQGPTASFKDFAARMMGRLMQYFLKLNNEKLLILTATSGDTGSAIANAFYKLNNIKVVVLFPLKEVTGRQRKQMTTLGNNIQIISVDGKFDDCQALVKKAFSDKELDYLSLSSANSINIGRLIPQIVYYFYSFAKLRKEKSADVIFSVPSGNFGDMMGGMIAKKMGLPVKKFIISTNENDEFPAFLNTGVYNKIEPSKNCISSAMNVGHPSNLARVVSLYGGNMDEKGVIHENPDMKKMREDIFSVSITDKKTKEIIKSAFEEYKLLLEPHGAVGWGGLHEFLKQNKEYNNKEQLCISLETAHPAKFPETITELLNIDPVLPESLKGLENKPEDYMQMNNDYEEFKKILIKKY